nr:MAG TPA: Protein of unknown function (DUF1366) [Caudoviricetes sp.]
MDHNRPIPCGVERIIMDLKFSSKSQEFELDGSVKGTKVILSNDDGAIYPVMLPADKISLSNSELEELALDVIYQKNFREKYENEKFTEIQAAIDKSEKITQLTTGTLNELISKMYPDEETTKEN